MPPLGLVGLDDDRKEWYTAGTAKDAAAGLFSWSANDTKVWPTWFDVRRWATLATDTGPSAVQVDGTGAPYVTRVSWGVSPASLKLADG